MKYILTSILLFLMLTLNAQELKLNTLISYIGKPSATVTDSLVSKDWILHPELSGVQKNQGYQTFAYGRLNTDENQALAWFRIQTENNTVNQLYYQINGLELFLILQKEINELEKINKIDERIENKQMITSYENDTFAIQTTKGSGSYTLMVAMKTP